MMEQVVKGTIALLWSILRNAKNVDIITSIINTGSNSNNRRSLIPPLVNAELLIKNFYIIPPNPRLSCYKE